MESTLKDYSYYDELYDKFTIKRCKQIIKDIREDERIRNEWNKRKFTSNIDELLVSKETSKSAFNKEETIKERIKRDEEIDKFIKSRKVPKAVCNSCSKLMELDNTIFKDWHWKKEDRVMFMFICNECKKRKAIYDNWEEYIVKKEYCPKCNTELNKSTKVKGNEYITTYKCEKCNYKKVDKLDLNLDEEDNSNFQEDRKKYCISIEEAESIQNRWENLYNEIYLITTWNDPQSVAKRKEEEKYRPLKKIKIMNYKELEDDLWKMLFKNWYTDFNLSKPDVWDDIKVYFSVFNNTWESDTMKSNKLLRKLIKEYLENTNWLFMDQWRFENRLWIIKWKLKGIDNKDKLLEIINNKKLWRKLI